MGEVVVIREDHLFSEAIGETMRSGHIRIGGTRGCFNRLKIYDYSEDLSELKKHRSEVTV
jgi:hypothetical protein